jgi:hypothetical protein
MAAQWSMADTALGWQVWDVIIAISCLYQGFMVPFSLCFEKIYIEKDATRSGETEQCLFSENVTIRYGSLSRSL